MFVCILRVYYYLAVNPGEVFRCHLADITDAISSNVLRIANALDAQSLIPSSIKDDLHGSNYNKANIITGYIQKYINSLNEPVEYLIDVCNVLLQRGDIRLKNIAASICEKLGKRIPQGMSSCRNHIYHHACLILQARNLTLSVIRECIPRMMMMMTKRRRRRKDNHKVRSSIKAACARRSL